MPGEPHAAPFHPVVRDWFARALGAPTPAQRAGWPLIRAGRSTLLLAPTGSGKTLAAFLAAIERLMFTPPPARPATRVLYVSPLKALAVDIERNLRVPLAGIAAAAAAAGVPHHVPAVALRTGDTPAGERARMRRRPPDILITTPESLYLLLTSSAQAMLATVATVIVDEVHALVPTKRGAHLALSLERLEEVRPPGAPPLQRIGLSATQRPPEEAARLLGGFAARPGRAAPRPREVAVVDARQARKLDVTVEVPAHELFLRGAAARGLAPAAAAAPGPSIWPALHPRLLELVRAHRSTIIFVNNRRLTERLAAALNDLAGDTVAQAHHGSLAREKRLEVEERLKAGALPAIVATSSLELGIDMGAVDLCIQIEAPPSVASGLQRIGRAGHRLDATSRGIIFPKFRGDLLASAAAARLMREHQVEETAYPRSPLDVLAQQLVAICAMGERHVDELYALCRRAAPFAELARGSFDGVLDMLAGRYPSDAFAGLKARLVWDRDTGTVRARAGAGRIAVTSGGTIPDRGLYGVFLASAEGRTVRVGELDEEMVFESRVGEVFLLGASAWRIEEITRDRVLVSPAPGQPGKMPFWHGDRPGRPLELGRAIGKLARDLVRLDDAAAQARLVADHALAPDAAASLVAYLREQRQATGEVPSDHVIVVERYQDEMGDWRVCVLMPFGARVHAPWCAAVEARLRRDAGLEVETLHGDDGIVFRFPEADAPPPVEQLVPSYADAEALILGHLPETALFAAHFREIAARALLLPRRLPGRRAPLWQQRKRAADLLQIAARYGSFPMVLETYRECLRDVFDMPALREVLDGVASRAIRVLTVTTRVPSPFAASLLFSYVGSFIYDADAPLAERRARALAVDLRQLRELLGEAELRDLLDADAIAAEERRLQALDPPPFCRDADDLHDLLVRLGDLTTAEIKTRCPEAGPALTALLDARRALPVRVGGEARLIAVEDAARYHDGAGVELPAGVPAAFREAVADPLGDLVSRYARTHGPFAAAEAAARLGVEVAPVLLALGRLQAQERIVEGELRPGRRGQEFCDAEVLRRVKQRSLARLRRAAEPVPVESYARFAREWQGLARPLAGPEALAAAVEQLQGAALPASVLETEVLPARVAEYRAGDLDALCAAGEVLWAGVEPLGGRDGRVALYLRARFAELAPPSRPVEGELAARLRDALARRGASFFADLRAELGGFGGDLLEALWELVWAGVATNDTLVPLRAFLRAGEIARPDPRRPGQFAARRALAPPGSEGRWSLLPAPAQPVGPTARALALAEQLLERHGVLTREAVAAEGSPGGFAALAPVLRGLEDAGRVRRGYFVEGLGAMQFALPGADDRLREARDQAADEVVVLAATDPANVYGGAVPWPAEAEGRAQRAAGASVVLAGGRLVGYLGRGEHELLVLGPARDPAAPAARTLAAALADLVDAGGRRALLLERIDGAPAAAAPAAAPLRARGFQEVSQGLLYRAGR